MPGVEHWLKRLNIYCRVVTSNFSEKAPTKKIDFLSDLSNNKDLPVVKIMHRIGEGEFSHVHMGEFKNQKVAAKILNQKKGSDALSEMYRELIIQSYFSTS